MARPKTKEELLNAAQGQYIKLLDLIVTLSLAEQTGIFSFNIENKKEAHWKRDRNIRDVLIHLYEWHQLLLNWVDTNKNGIEKPFLPEGYNWKTYGDMNVEFWQKHQDTAYTNALEMLSDSHYKVIKLIESFADEELFSKNAFKWVGGSTLGSYCVSATSSHYDWAIKKVKEYKKSIN